MLAVSLVLVVNALAGLAIGFAFRAWANIVVAPIMALGSVLVFIFCGFSIMQTVMGTFMCLFVGQLAYVTALFFALPISTAWPLPLGRGFGDAPSCGGRPI